jgi:hypothetical protein
MRADDAYAGLLKPGVVIDLPDPPRERALGHLQRLGLLTIEARDYVRCVNPLDHDQRFRKDLACDGRIWLEPQRRREDNHDYRCPDCDRVIFPSRKRAASAYRVEVDPAALDAHLETALQSVGLAPVRRGAGWWRVLVDGVDVDVVLVDAGPPRRLLSWEYGNYNPVLYVLGNDRDLQKDVPFERASLRLVDVILGGKNTIVPLLTGLAGLARGDGAPAREVRAAFIAPTASVSTAASPLPAAPAVGRRITESGSEEITREAYLRAVEAAAEVDLFIDGVARPARFAKRLPDGTRDAGQLTDAELRLLVGMITRPGPHRPKEIDRSLQDGIKIFEMARRKVDVDLGRYRWRAFSLHRSGVDRVAKEYAFTPPAGFRFCVLLPVAGARAIAGSEPASSTGW